MRLPYGVKDITPIAEDGSLVHLDSQHLPDLDALMLDLLVWQNARRAQLGDEREPLLDDDSVWVDEPTSIDAAYYSREADVGYFRKNPCVCGGEHRFDMDDVSMDDDGRPVGRRARGAFLGVYFR